MELDIYKAIYDFASSAGSLEGYLFQIRKLEPASLDDWINNLTGQYHELPVEVRESVQPSLDRTIGRAVLSLIPLLGEEHDHIRALKSLIKGELPKASDDFTKEKEEKAKRYS